MKIALTKGAVEKIEEWLGDHDAGHEVVMGVDENDRFKFIFHMVPKSAPPTFSKRPPEALVIHPQGYEEPETTMQSTVGAMRNVIKNYRKAQSEKLELRLVISTDHTAIFSTDVDDIVW